MGCLLEVAAGAECDAVANDRADYECDGQPTQQPDRHERRPAHSVSIGSGRDEG